MIKYFCILLLGTVLLGCKANKGGGSSVRPEDFPRFLKAPENARDLRYSTSKNAYMMENSYGLNYVIDEKFPPKETINFIHNQLSEAGFFLLKYCTINLFEITYKWQPNTLREPGYVELEWAETWATKTRLDSVLVYLMYPYKVDKKDLTELYVSVSYFDEKTPVSDRIKRYKDRYPVEEWEKRLSDIEFDKIWAEEDKKNNW